MLLEARQNGSRRPDGELLAGDLKDERAEGIQPREFVDPRARTEVWMRVDQARENRIGVSEEAGHQGCTWEP
jgi:hypothetical protein